MCIVVDTNALSPVFNSGDKLHDEFFPVFDWINKRRGILVLGGKKYESELGKTKYYKIIRLLKDSGKAVRISDQKVDSAEKDIIKKTEGTDCDDQHIIALLGVSRCPLFCTNDKRSHVHIKNKDLYPSRMKRVKIYSSRKNLDLLVPMNRDILRNTT